MEQIFGYFSHSRDFEAKCLFPHMGRVGQLEYYTRELGEQHGDATAALLRRLCWARLITVTLTLSAQRSCRSDLATLTASAAAAAIQ